VPNPEPPTPQNLNQFKQAQQVERLNEFNMLDLNKFNALDLNKFNMLLAELEALLVSVSLVRERIVLPASSTYFNRFNLIKPV